MRLFEYRKLKQLSRQQAADQIGVNASTYWRWEKSITTPKPVDIRKIFNWSNGAVTANDFITPLAHGMSLDK